VILENTFCAEKLLLHMSFARTTIQLACSEIFVKPVESKAFKLFLLLCVQFQIFVPVL